MFNGFETGIRHVNGQDIAYVKGGSGEPVLLLHGFPQTKAMWAHIAPEIAKNYTVVCADLRGYGHSSKPACTTDASNYTFREMANDQLALMQSLGLEKFHLIGHDRGGRTSHRMALDHPQALKSLTVMDIVPTYTMFSDVTRQTAGSYWHWYFLSQPAPFPETMIEGNPDFFYETCLVGWGASKLSDYHPEQLADYRHVWRTKEMIQGSCGDYRAAATLDLAMDSADIERKVDVRSLVLFGSNGVMHKLFDIPAEWKKRLSNMQSESLPGGHFFPDQLPKETAQVLMRFLNAR